MQCFIVPSGPISFYTSKLFQHIPEDLYGTTFQSHDSKKDMKRMNMKKKELEELANIELSLDASGNVEEVEERMKQVEARVLDRLSLLEERLTDALLKKKSAF